MATLFAIRPSYSMLRFTQQQFDQIGKAMFAERLGVAMRRAVPQFREFSLQARASFIEDCQQRAAACGLRSEQGIASYALAAWFLTPGFETRSRHLTALLASAVPEVRKVYAMNEWVRELIGAPEAVAAADQVLRQTFRRTDAWGWHH